MDVAIDAGGMLIGKDTALMNLESNMLLKKHSLMAVITGALLVPPGSLAHEPAQQGEQGSTRHQQPHHLVTASGITAHQGWARALPPVVKTGAVYLTLQNDSGDENAIIGAHSDRAERVEIHHTWQDGDGMMVMSQLERVELPPGAAVIFQPGGQHLMLIGLTAPLQAGQQFPLYLKMARGGDVKVMVDIRAVSAGRTHH